MALIRWVKIVRMQGNRDSLMSFEDGRCYRLSEVSLVLYFVDFSL